MKSFEVTISKTLETTVNIKASSKKEAENIACERWLEGEYELEDKSYEPNFTVKENKEKER